MLKSVGILKSEMAFHSRSGTGFVVKGVLITFLPPREEKATGEWRR